MCRAIGDGGRMSGFFLKGMTLEQWEDEMVREALRRANGNKSAGGAAAGTVTECAAVSAIENWD